MPKGRDLLFDALEQQDIGFLFGNPGTTELPLIDGCNDHPSVRYVMALHEDIAVGMAMGFARASGKVGVVNLHVAPGLAHGLGNLYNAWRARIPLLVTAGQQHTRLVIQEPILTADLVDMARPFTKWAHEVHFAEELPIALQRAFKEALTPPQGPVFLSLPVDVMLADTDQCLPRLAQFGTATRGDDAELARAAALLAAAENPLIVAGDGVGLSDAWPELIALAERLGAHVCTEGLPSVWNFPNRHDHWRGIMPDTASAYRSVFDGVDVALLGGYSSHAPLAVFDAGGPLIPPTVKIVALNDNAWEIGKNQPVAAGILGDVKLNLGALMSALRATSQPRSAVSAATRRRSAIADFAEQRRARWQHRVAEARQRDVLSATAVAAELAEVMPAQATFCDETVSNRQPFVNLLDFNSPLSYWSGKGGGLGFSMPGALGMKLARPDRVVVNGIGDGSFLYYPQALWTAANLELATVVFIVLNNSSYRVLKIGVQRMGGPWDAGGAYPPGLDIEGPRVEIAATAQAMGVQAERIERPADLRPALERAFAAGRPYLLDIALEGAV